MVPFRLRDLRRAWLISFAGLVGCAAFTGPSPMMGTVKGGIYIQPSENFACPVTGKLPGLQSPPRITDTYRLVKTETIPLSQRAPGNWKASRILSDKTLPSRLVRFEYSSGAVIEFSSGTLSHPEDRALNDGFGRGFAWPFLTRERVHQGGRLMSGLLLVPWYEEGVEYMGVDPAEAYRQGQGPDPQLWIRHNLLVGEAIHVVTLRLPVAPMLAPNIDSRDLPAIRDYFNAYPPRKHALLAAAASWLDRCQFAERMP